MKNKVTFKEEPTLFDDITEFEIERIEDHRRGSSFYTKYIIEFKDQHKEYFPEIANFHDYLGTWITDQIITDSEYGTDETVSELTRVKQKEIVSYAWVEVK